LSTRTGSAKRAEARPPGGARPDPPVHDRALQLLRAGIILVVAGTALALAGILAAALFRPGTYIILIGLIAAAAAGVWSAFQPDSGVRTQ